MIYVLLNLVPILAAKVLAITLGYRGVSVRLIARDCAHWLVLMVSLPV